MKLFRIAKKQFAQDLSGEGARLFGGRWNSRGTAMVYTSESRALAFAETFVNSSVAIIDKLPLLCSMLVITLPDKIKIEEQSLSKLPKGWANYPHHPELAVIGDNWIKTNSGLLLRVPSAVVRGEYNILINPFHAEARKIKWSIEEFPFDQRLFRGKDGVE